LSLNTESVPSAASRATPERALVHRSPAAAWLPVLIAGAGVWSLPIPAALEPRAWNLLAIFVGTVVGLISRPLPLGAVALLGIVATVITGTLTIGEALSGFSNSVVWLVITAFFIASGFLKTGLGPRIAYLFLAALGKRTLGLSYGLVATDLVLAPVIPSNTARAAGVVFPILRSLAAELEARMAVGGATRAFLTLTAYQGTVVTSAMFLTAMVANPLVVELAGKLGVQISWGTWAIAAMPPGLCSLIVVPFILYRLCPPDVSETPAATELARSELARMGRVTPAEWTMLAVFVVLLLLWIAGPGMGIDATTAALVGLALLLLSGVLAWADLSGDQEAWNTAVWFATLVMMATFLNDLGLTRWFSDQVGTWLRGMSWVPAFLALSLLYFYSHYLFASNTAHVSSMYAPFLAVALAVGTPPMLAALVLAFFSNLFAGLTHYGTAPAPIFFGAGYVAMGVWWKLGAIISVVNITIWLTVGGLWWKLLGLW